jgi:hypothetical protein
MRRYASQDSIQSTIVITDLAMIAATRVATAARVAAALSPTNILSYT